MNLFDKNKNSTINIKSSAGNNFASTHGKGNGLFSNINNPNTSSHLQTLNSGP